MIRSFHRIGVNYSAECDWPEVDYFYPRFDISPADIKHILESAASLPEVADGDIDDHAKLSFAIIVTEGTPRAFEALLDRSHGRIRDAGLVTPGLQTELDVIACSQAMAGPGPADVTGAVEVNIGDFQIDEADQRLVGVITPPVSLILGEGWDSTVLNPDGRACNLAGLTYFDLDVGMSFDPGESIAVRVQLVDEGAPGFTFLPKVYADPEVR